MQNESRNARLKRLTASAFPNSVSLSHAGCEDLRTKLFSLHDKDVRLALGPVLMDLLDTHSSSMGTPDWSDSVVRFLGAAEARPPTQSVPGVFLDTGQMDEWAESARPAAEKCFNTFTLEQSRAVYEWLLAAKSWKESNIPEDELSVALNYWKRRCGF
jgi:hypothetical protein